MTEEEKLAEFLKSQGYMDARVLPDGTVIALLELMTTRSICLDCNRDSWERRFCFSDRALATEWFYKLQSSDEIPTGYVARRPKYEDLADPYLNELHKRDVFDQKLR